MRWDAQQHGEVLSEPAGATAGDHPISQRKMSSLLREKCGSRFPSGQKASTSEASPQRSLRQRPRQKIRLKEKTAWRLWPFRAVIHRIGRLYRQFEISGVRRFA